MKAWTSSTSDLPSGPCVRGHHGKVQLLSVMKATGWVLALLVVAAFLFAEAGCAAQHAPQPVVVNVCPPIPVPPAPEAPHVVLPKPDAEGNYCLTQSQINDLAQGIRALQTWAAQMTAAAKVYNQSVKQANGPKGGTP